MAHKVLLLDGDGFVYRAGFAAERTFYDVYNLDWGDSAPPVASFQYKKECDTWIGSQKTKDRYSIDKRKEIQPEVNALSNAKTIMKGILGAFKGCDYVGYLSGKDNFREKVATIKVYKGHRINVPKPVHYKAIREYFIKHWDFFVVNGEEADDAVAIAQYNDFKKYPLLEQESAATVLVTQDKDLDMVPGWHYDWVKKNRFFVDPLTGIRSFYKQLLKGDGTDNIPGLFYITGSKCSKKYLDTIDKLEVEEEMYSYVREIYVESLKPELSYIRPTYTEIDKILEETGQLLWMRRENNEYWKAPVSTTPATGGVIDPSDITCV